MASIRQNLALIFLLFCLLQPISAQKSEISIDWVSEESTAQQSWQLKPREDSRFCEAWRYGVETNTLRNWKKIPSECEDFVENYMMGSQYALDSSIVANESIAYASSLHLSNNGKDAWVFDVDETLLSNLRYYQDQQFGALDFDENSFDNWVIEAEAPALSSSYRVYTHLLQLGFKVFLLTGRDETMRNVTAKNLILAGYHTWEELLLRGPGDHGTSAVVYKSDRRSKIEQAGFQIRGNSGDQWSDLTGYSVGDRTFKLPNPMYYIA